MSKRRRKWAMPSSNARSVSWFSRSPMWWETNARPPRARQNVFLSSAPHARTGGPSPMGIGSGA